MVITETRPSDLGGALRLLADPTRLRMLALLEAEELSVGELSRALDLAQSRVSNHLRLLREAGLLRERRVGTSTFQRLDLSHAPSALAGRLWEVVRDEIASLPEQGADRVRLASVLTARHQEEAFFDRLAGDWDKVAGAFETGRARERLAAHLLPSEFVAADLGCGTGTMGEALLGIASRLICVDRSEGMLAEAARRLASRAGTTRLEMRQGELDRLPIADAELDGLVCGMVLHHLPTLDGAVSEMHRVLAPGGTAVVLELSPHHEEWMRAELGDRHLGLPPAEVLAAFERAGFTDLVLDPVEDRYCPRRPDADPEAVAPSLSMYIVRGRTPGTRPG